MIDEVRERERAHERVLMHKVRLAESEGMEGSLDELTVLGEFKRGVLGWFGFGPTLIVVKRLSDNKVFYLPKDLFPPVSGRKNKLEKIELVYDVSEQIDVVTNEELNRVNIQREKDGLPRLGPRQLGRRKNAVRTCEYEQERYVTNVIFLLGDKHEIAIVNKHLWTPLVDHAIKYFGAMSAEHLAEKIATRGNEIDFYKDELGDRKDE